MKEERENEWREERKMKEEEEREKIIKNNKGKKENKTKFKCKKNKKILLKKIAIFVFFDKKSYILIVSNKFAQKYVTKKS